MKAPRVVVLAAALVLAACSSTSTAGQLPGPVPDGVAFIEPADDAPDAPAFELDLVDGRTLDLAEQWAQRPVVLVFFESWCTLCAEQQDDINAVVAEYRDTVLFVGIAGLSDVSDVETYVADQNVEYPVGTDPDGDIWLRYAVAEAPLVALISKDGRLLRGWPQGVKGADLREQIASLAVESH